MWRKEFVWHITEASCKICLRTYSLIFWKLKMHRASSKCFRYYARIYVGLCIRSTIASMKKWDFTNSTGGAVMGHAKLDHLTLACWSVPWTVHQVPLTSGGRTIKQHVGGGTSRFVNLMDFLKRRQNKSARKVTL